MKMPDWLKIITNEDEEELEPVTRCIKRTTELCSGDQVLLQLGWATLVYQTQSMETPKGSKFDRPEMILEFQYEGRPDKCWLGRSALNGREWKRNA